MMMYKVWGRYWGEVLGGDVDMVGVVSDRLSCAGVWSGLFMNDAVLLAYRNLSERL